MATTLKEINDDKVLRCLLAGLSPSEIAVEASMSEEAVRQRLKNRAFMSEVHKQRGQILEQIINRVVSKCSTAMDCLGRMLAAPDAGTRFKAAQILLDAGLKWKSLEMLDARLTRLEEKFGSDTIDHRITAETIGSWQPKPNGRHELIEFSPGKGSPDNQN